MNKKSLIILRIIVVIVASLFLIIELKSAKVDTFEECEKAGLLMRYIVAFDGDSPLEKKCVLWSGKSFIKESSQKQKAVEMATAHLSFPITVIEVIKLGCEGCYSVKLQRNDTQHQFTIVLDNWTIKH